MSEFYPTTYASFYTTHTPFDDYDTGEGFVPQLVMSRIPIQILESSDNQYQPVDDRLTTVEMFTARVRGHRDLKLDYRVLDERSGEWYSIDEISKKHNPVGDQSWVLSLRRIDPEGNRS